jgi:DNA relaxase NicK
MSPKNSESRRTRERAGLSGSSLEIGMEERIRQRAYELYEERGREEGHAEEDWLRAEAEVRKPLSQAAKAGQA